VHAWCLVSTVQYSSWSSSSSSSRRFLGFQILYCTVLYKNVIPTSAYYNTVQYKTFTFFHFQKSQMAPEHDESPRAADVHSFHGDGAAAVLELSLFLRGLPTAFYFSLPYH